MKKFILLLTALFAAYQVYADTEKVSLIIGATKSIQVPFVIDSYTKYYKGEMRIVRHPLRKKLNGWTFHEVAIAS